VRDTRNARLLPYVRLRPPQIRSIEHRSFLERGLRPHLPDAQAPPRGGPRENGRAAGQGEAAAASVFDNERGPGGAVPLARGNAESSQPQDRTPAESLPGTQGRTGTPGSHGRKAGEGMRIGPRRTSGDGKALEIPDRRGRGGRPRGELPSDDPPLRQKLLREPRDLVP